MSKEEEWLMTAIRQTVDECIYLQEMRHIVLGDHRGHIIIKLQKQILDFIDHEKGSQDLKEK